MSSYEFLWVPMFYLDDIARPIRTHSNLLEPIRLRRFHVSVENSNGCLVGNHYYFPL